MSVNGLNVAHIRRYIIKPVLAHLGLSSLAAENLLLGTAAQESNFRHLHQLHGDALGLFQMEPATHEDIWQNYLAYNPALMSKVYDFMTPGADPQDQLIWNLGYSAALARVHYRRVPSSLPPAHNVEALGAYWKAHYNTPQGAGTVAQFVTNYQKYVAGAE